jgi:cystathionine beta-lyase/cystathionine gamma-synthase
MKFKTLAIHAGHSPADHIGAVMTPIYQTSTFAFRGVNRPGAFDYSRLGNPTRKALETCLASLESGSSGFAFATGMAAETTVLMMFDSGDRIVVHSDLYGTYRLFQSVLRSKGIEAVYMDLRNAAATERVLADGAAAVWIESPTNPLMNLLKFNCPAAKTASTRLDRGALRIRAASDRIPTNPRRRLRCRGIPRRRDSE